MKHLIMPVITIMLGACAVNSGKSPQSTQEQHAQAALIASAWQCQIQEEHDQHMIAVAHMSLHFKKNHTVYIKQQRVLEGDYVFHIADAKHQWSINDSTITISVPQKITINSIEQHIPEQDQVSGERLEYTRKNFQQLINTTYQAIAPSINNRFSYEILSLNKKTLSLKETTEYPAPYQQKTPLLTACEAI